MEGKFITIEGIEGCGKTTQIRHITEYLTNLGINVKYMREPGGIKLGEHLRNVILGDEYKDMSLMTETMLFLTIRAENVDKIIKPAIDSGIWVVCDRFMDSTYAYQCYLKGMSKNDVDYIHDVILGEYYPDRTFIMDLSVEDSLKRLQGRDESNRFDKMPIEMHTKIRDAYLSIAQRGGPRYTIIDASNKPFDVFCEMKSYLDELL